jgi:hypothetical protein
MEACSSAAGSAAELYLLNNDRTAKAKPTIVSVPATAAAARRSR